MESKAKIDRVRQGRTITENPELLAQANDLCNRTVQLINNINALPKQEEAA